MFFVPLRPKKCILFLEFPMKNVGIFFITVSFIAGCESNLAHCDTHISTAWSTKLLPAIDKKAQLTYWLFFSYTLLSWVSGMYSTSLCSKQSSLKRFVRDLTLLLHTMLELHFNGVKSIYLSKHLKKSNAACFYTPVVLKLLTIVQMWKQHEKGN